MADKFFTGRIQLLRDTEEHWLSVKDTFVPLEGEACLTIDGSNKGRVKYGDGFLTWGELTYSDKDVDGSSLKVTGHIISLDGYASASNGQVPSKTSQGFDWISPVKAIIIGNEVESPIEPTDSGNLVIPIASTNNLGVVKASSEIGVDSQGEMSLNSVSASKVQYDEYVSIKEVIDRRTSWEPFVE